nr:hypothetical protein [Mariprofundus ferrooxydans]
MEMETCPTEKMLNLRSLAPADDKLDGTYKQALDKALSDSSIRNIALTGPYGSGKSTVLLSYEKNRIESARKSRFQKGGKPFLKISLASFVTEKYERAYADSDTINQPRGIPEEGHEKILQKVERGILEQMIYSLSADKLPQSRFRRITSPRMAWPKASFTLIWLSLIGFGYMNSEQALAILKDAIVNYPPVLSFLAFIAFAIPPIYLIAKIYEATFGITLGKLSLKNLELEASNKRNQSVLNQHIDEILYFFEAAKYQVVVFEDLDRFGTSEIFFKLKELNKVINDNLSAEKPVKFIYALKDAMIKGEDRTKFFDLIIPVVPVINPNNSLDMFHGELEALGLNGRVDKKLIAGASVFIVDPRLIANILNEFEIYASIIAETDTDLSRLLAIIIYKNTYPEDFEMLHHKDGVLFKLTSAKKEFIKKRRGELDQRIKGITSKLANIEEQQKLGEKRLAMMYVGYFVNKYAGNQVAGVTFGNNRIPFSNLTLDNLLQIKSTTQAYIYYINNPNGNRGNVDFSQAESELHPGYTIEEMAEQIRADVNGLEESLEEDAADLAKEVDQLPFKRLSELYHDGYLEDFMPNGLEGLRHQPALFEFLVKGGYVDETYPIYTSLFHEGRLTRDDYNFICGAMHGIEAAPEARVNKPEEICDTFEPKDFESPHFWNIAITDFLVTNSGYRRYLEAEMKYLSCHIEDAERFLLAYLSSAKQRDEFLRAWGRQDEEMASKTIANEAIGVLFIQRLLHAYSGSHIPKLLRLNQNGSLSDFLSKHGEKVFAPDYDPPADLQALKKLGVRFIDLDALRHANAVAEYACKHTLYQINDINIVFHLKHLLDGRLNDESQIVTGNYTKIIHSNDQPLQEYVSENINTYVRDVLLKLPDNTKEAAHAIRSLLNHEDLEIELKQQLIGKQERVFDSFEDIPEEFWGLLVDQGKITPSIENFLAQFYAREDDEAIVDLLNSNSAWVTAVVSGYRSEVFAEGKQLEFDRWIFNCVELHSDVYKQLVNAIETRFKTFPSSLGETKSLILANAGRVGLNEESFPQTEGLPEERAALIATNRGRYFAGVSNYPIDDDDRAALLESQLSAQDKLRIVEGAEFDPSEPHAELSAGIARLLLETGVGPGEVEPGLLAHAIEHVSSADDALTLLFKCQDKLNGNQVVWTMHHMPEPYDDLVRRRGKPTLPTTPGNLKLAQLLFDRQLISKFDQKGKKIYIQNFHKPRPHFSFEGQL